MSRIFALLCDVGGMDRDAYLVRVPDEMVGAYRTLFSNTECVADFDEEDATVLGSAGAKLAQVGDVYEWDDFWPYGEELGTVETPAHARIVVAILANGKSWEAEHLRKLALPHLEELFALSQKDEA
jgi:hypothetical protein